MAQGYFYDETPETVAQKRAIAARALQQALGQTPRTIGQGLTSVANALTSRWYNKAATKGEKSGRTNAQQMIAEILRQQNAGQSPGAPGAAGGPAPQPPAAVSPAGGSVLPSTPIEAYPLGADNGLPPGMMEAVYTQESGNNPNAVSPKGATGYGQVMPATARDPGYGVPNIFETAASLGVQVPDDSDQTVDALLKNEDVNRAFSENYMRAMYEKNGGDVATTLASYNAGPGAVDQYGGVPPYAETQDYVQKITENMGMATPPATPGFNPAAGAPPTPMLPGSAPGVAPTPPQAAPIQSSIDPRLIEALNNPWLSDGQRQVIQTFLGEQIKRAYPAQLTPYQQAQLAQGQAGLDLKRQKAELDLQGGADLATENRMRAAKGLPPMSPSEFAQAKKGEGVTVYDPVTGNPIATVGGSGTKLTEGQAKGSTYAQRAIAAQPVLDQFDKELTSFWDKAAGDVPLIGNYMQSEDYQKARQAGEVWLQAILRKDTGAAITTQEQELYGVTYLPQPGDKPEVIEQKRQMRQVAQDALQAGLPPQEMQFLAQKHLQTLQAYERSQSAVEGQGLKVGVVEDGYRYLGGDPGSPDSWEAVQ